MTQPDDTQPRSPFERPERAQRAPVTGGFEEENYGQSALPRYHDDPTPPRRQTPEFGESLELPADYEPGRVMPGGRPPDVEGPAGPGCVLWAVVLLIGGLLAVMIVVLAGAAGWTEGQRIAERNTQATLADFAGRQLSAIETNVTNLNSVQLATRIAFLATRTPGVPQVPALYETATAVNANATATQVSAIDAQLTAIPQAVAAGDSAQVEQRLGFLATQTPGVAEVAAFQATATALAGQPVVVDAPVTDAVTQSDDTPAPPAAASPTPGTLDPAALLADAQRQLEFGELEEAIDTLDLIIRLDPDFQRSTVETLLHEALVQRARALYNVDLSNSPRQTGTLAEAVRLTNLAEQYDTIESIAYERDIATLYLNAISAVEAGNHGVAINRLNAIMPFQTQYKGVNLNRLLFNELVAYGDAFFQFDRNYCQAAAQYEAALTLFSDARVQGQLQAAQDFCAQGQQAPGGTPAPGETAVAPIGVPGT
ncbi:MAG: hypothetical protein ACOCYT_04340 [Chloroflexota bacterium]